MAVLSEAPPEVAQEILNFGGLTLSLAQPKLGNLLSSLAYEQSPC